MNQNAVCSQSRWANAMLCNGIDAELLDAQQVRELEPRLNFGSDARFPILGGFMQRRAGPVRPPSSHQAFRNSALPASQRITCACAAAG